MPTSEADFRRIALALDGVEERSHMAHPDFRVGGRVFASIKADRQHAAVRLTTEEQAALIEASPRAYSPESGAWGRQGWTRIALVEADEEMLGEALTLARRGMRRVDV